MEDWTNGISLTLKRKDGWWGDDDTSKYLANYPEKIIFRFIKDDVATALELKKGGLDYSPSIADRELENLKQSKNFTDKYYFDYLNQYSYLYLAMNMKPGSNRKPFFTDKKVRRAMAHLTPVDELIKVIANGKGKRLVSTITPLDSQNYHYGLKLIEYDIEKAKKLLDEAGWKDTDGDNLRDKKINGKKIPFSFKLMYFGSGPTDNLVKLVKDGMYQAGIDLQLDPVDPMIWQQRATAHDFDMLLGSWSGSPPPGDDMGELWLTENWKNNSFNFTGFGDAKTDLYIKKSNQTIDPATRGKYLRLLQEIIYEEQPYIFLYVTKRKTIISKRFETPKLYEDMPVVLLNNLRRVKKNN